MKAHSNPEPDKLELRRRAEERHRQQRLKAEHAPTQAGMESLVHELQIHQIELEMQNEELQNTRRELELGLEKYSDLYDFAPLAYLTLNPEGMIGEANLASGILLGKERALLLQRRFAPCITLNDRAAFITFLAKVFASGIRESCELKLSGPDKAAVDVRIEAVVAIGGKECRVLLADITQQKRAEADRLILQKLEATAVLAAGIAHDFNNLLTVILLDLELAQTLKLSGGESTHLLEEAKKAALTAGSLTRQFFDFAERGSPVPAPTLLAEVIPKAVELTLKDSNVRCEVSLAPDLWQAQIDAAQITRVFQNLAQNAMEAMPQGGLITIRGENMVVGERGRAGLPAGDYVRLSVRDCGVGVAKDVLPKMFDPYYSTKERGTQKGMGLGLTICHSVIRQHGGAISAESEPGVGTRFQIDLPASTRDQKGTVAGGMPRRGRVLVMDDEEQLRKVVGLTLWGLGQTVEVAENGNVAVKLYKKGMDLERPFDVVILDLTVRGGMGGLATLRALLKIDPEVKAIVTSGYSDSKVMQEYESHGFKGAVRKPFNQEKLREILVRIMGSHSENDGSVEVA